MLDRRTFLARAAAGAVAASLAPLHAAEKPARKPNIILIVADDLGYGDLGCYGQKRIRTPNLDALAAAGIRFAQHYSGSAVCAPSRCVLMTGLHTGHAVIRGNTSTPPMGQMPLPADTITVARLLQQAGYATGLVGKWGLGGPDSVGHPNKQGFDYFYGYLCQHHAHNYYPEFLFRNDQRVPLEGNRIEKPNPNGSGVAVERAKYSHDLIAGEAIAFVERNREKPFFLCFTPTIPHANSDAGKNGMEVPSDEPYSKEDWPQAEKNFAAMITRLDRDIGRLVAKLRELGLERDTLILFTSDNGPHREGGHDAAFFNSSGPLRGTKRDTYEGGVRVPLIACWPGTIAAGQASNHVCAFWDFLPTACDVAGVPAPKGIDGISYRNALLGRPQAQHDHLYWEFHEQGGKLGVRQGDWKAVRLNTQKQPDGPVELYNLADDLAESRNVAAAHPEIAARLAGLMRSSRVPGVIPAWK